jgi:lycopene beta-cyclase
MNSPQYDYIFAGFGLAGMSLLYEMSKFPDFANKKILVIDSDKKQQNDRTYSFWYEKLDDYEEIISKKWNKSNYYSRKGKLIQLDMGSYKYGTIQGIDFYNFISKKLGSFKNIEYVTEAIQACRTSGIVETESNNYSAAYVFKSYFKREELQFPKHTIIVWQHFKGWVIKTPEATFNDSSFTFMDYQFSEKGKLSFFYVLPFSNDYALVEFTEFSNDFYSQEEYDSLVKAYIEDHLKIKEYSIEETEFNAIPMTDYRMANPVQDKLVHIGTIAGFVKPSSGYSFTRTIQKNKIIAERIMNNKGISKGDYYTNPIYHLFDTALLDRFDTSPENGKQFYDVFFSRMKAFRIFDFLDEKITLKDFLRIMAIIPKGYLFVWWGTKRFFLNVYLYLSNQKIK